ncbi:MAG: hypothetical protein JWL77_7125, partial [Chthonomonadaceae bacterium]|nr:hypothetical protein [Chthonomonadaceae bacterium]
KADEQGKKLDEKIDALSKEILPALSAGSDAKINGMLKGQKITVKNSDWLNAQSNVIPGVGSLRSIQGELLAMKKGEPAKKFSLMGGTFYAVVSDQEVFDPSKLTEKEKTETLAKLQNQKQSELLSEFIKASMKKATVSRNDRVVVGNAGAQTPVTPDN